MNEKYGIELELLTSAFNKQVEKVKKTAESIKKAFDPNDVSGMKINGNLQKEISGISKEFQKLSGKKISLGNAVELQNYKNKLQSIGKECKRIENNTKVLFKSYNTEAIQQVVNEYGQVEKKVEKTKNEVKKLNKETKKLTAVNTGVNKLTKGIEKATSKIKRFALSLFSIRSIYALVSKASSAYLSQDTELANKLQAVWVGLGSMLEPIISAIANTLIKGVKYINIFITALTGVDLLTKALAKSMKNTNSSTKALSKTLAGFDELTNLDTSSSNIDTSWINAFNEVELNPVISQMLENLALKVSELKQRWDEIDPSIQNIIKILGIGGLLGILTGNGGLISGIVTLVLGVDGLCKIFDNDLTTSATGLMELLGMAGLIGVLTGKAGLAAAIGAVVLALFGLNEMIKGDTGEAIEGMILLLGGAGLAGVLIGKSWQGASVGVAIASVIVLLRGLSDLFTGDATTSVKGFIEIVTGTGGLIIAISLIKGGLAAILTPLNLAVLGFTALASGIYLVVKNWDNMSTLQKVVSILGLIAVGAAAAAAAVGALQSAWSLGIAATAIVAGTAAIAASVSSASKKAQENIPQLSVGTNYVPEDQLAYIHQGEAVIPKKFNSQEYFGSGNEETNSLLEQVIEAINNIEIAPYTTIKDVGQASIDFINGKTRQYGRSVI